MKIRVRAAPLTHRRPYSQECPIPRSQLDDDRVAKTGPGHAVEQDDPPRFGAAFATARRGDVYDFEPAVARILMKDRGGPSRSLVAAHPVSRPCRILGTRESRKECGACHDPREVNACPAHQ